MAAGCPVIAFNKGGAKETVKAGVSGTFFNEQTAESLAKVIVDFDLAKYDSVKIAAWAQQFSAAHFTKAIQHEISGALSPGFSRL